MPATVLTPRFVAVAKPRRTAGGLVRAEFPDAGCSGLYLVVQPTGAKSWAFRFHQQGVTGKKTLGSAGPGGLTLSAARAAAALLRHRLERDGERPNVTPVTPATALSGGGGQTVESAVAAFLELHARRKNRASTAGAAERTFNRLVLPAWRGRAIADIRRRDVIDLVEHVATDRPYLANRLLAVLSKFFGWLLSRDMLAMSPCAGVKRPHVEKARKRTLSDIELGALLRAADRSHPSERAVWILALTGCRRSEAGRMKWACLDTKRRTWTIPAEDSKNRLEHVVALSSQAWAIIDAQPRLANCPYVFSAHGRGPVNDWDQTKKRLSRLAKLDEKGWRLHDLRRTCAVGLQGLQVPVPVIERALNHRSGTFQGIVGVYQVHDYANEVRLALQQWGDRVEQLVFGEKPSVVPIRKRRQR